MAPTHNTPAAHQSVSIDNTFSLYKALSLSFEARSIRVLQLNDADEDDAPLTGTMRVISLKKNPEYTALSYVWGPFAKQPDTITCNGARLPISINCHDALKHLRQLFGPITIWVDAICINQDDISDKNMQVPLMGDIYSKAQATYVWLWPGTPASCSAIQWLRVAAKFRLSMRVIQSNSMLMRSTIIGARFYEATWNHVLLWLKDPSLMRIWDYRRDDMQELLGRGWISRAWTFQELVLSPNPVFVCGRQALDWDTLIRGLHFLHLRRKARVGPRTQSPFNRSMLRPRGSTLIRWSMAVKKRLQGGLAILARDEDMPAALEQWLTTLHIWMTTQAEQPKRTNQRRLESPSRLAQCFDADEHSLRFPALMLVHVLILFLPLLAMLRSLTEWRVVGIVTLLLATGFLYFGLSNWQLVMPFLPNTDLKAPFESGTGLEEGILQALRRRGATEPKDRSYALTGVLQFMDAPISSDADYRKSKGHVYRDLLTDLVRWRPSNLSLLLDVRPSGLPGAPSWVPDWTTVSADQGSEWYSGNNAAQGARDTRSDVVEALVEGRMLKVRMRDSKRIDYVSGTFDGFAARADNLLRDDNKVDEQSAAALLSLLRWFIRAYHPGWSDEDFGHSLSILLDTLGLHAGWYWYLQRSSPEWKKLHKILSAAVEDIFRLALSTTIDTFLARNPDWENNQLRALVELARSDTLVFSFLDRLFRQISREQRCMIVLGLGMLGTTWVGIKPGDIVAIIRGVHKPFALRRLPARSSHDQVYQALGPVVLKGKKARDWEFCEDGETRDEAYLDQEVILM